jgi:predicted nucleic-acid-binding Zn-ribbon protein
MALQETRLEDGSIGVTIEGKPLICIACRNDRYRERGSLLNSRGGEFFGFAWADEKATNFVCTKCGYIFWFLI